jgi:sphinganine-1-phosphate aldolase
MPAQGRDADDVIAELAALRDHDVDWRGGRTFGLVFDGGDGVHDVAERAALLYLHENALNTAAFPSLGRIQADVVAWTSELLHGTAGTAGFLTSGGTESIQCAVLAARERARDQRGITAPVIVVAESAHAAFHKSAHLFGMEIRTAPVLADWTADVDAMASLVDDRTVLVVGSAPQYPQGVVDPIPAIVDLAVTVGAHVHVDACMGGFVLPFVERLGRPVPPWDFRVEGVDSISADVHKLGYAPKGASVIAYRTKELRRYQTFFFDAWLGGMYASPNLQGTRAGLPMATAWAVMAHLGIDGYVERTRATLAAADDLRAAVAALDGVRVLGDGAFHLVAIASDTTAARPVDVFAVGDGLKARGWHLDRQGPPDALHLTVSAGNVVTMPAFIADLQAVVAEVADATSTDRTTSYATLE